MAELFPNFPDDYDQAVAWWVQLWAKIAPGGWESPFFNHADSDGNPIFSAYDSLTNKAVRVIQSHSGEDEGDEEENFVYWWSVLDPECQHIQELVVWVHLTDVTAVLAENVIRSWVNDNLAYGADFS
jgi:hypothetical protein